MRLTVAVCCTVPVVCIMLSTAAPGTDQAAVPREVRDLEGTYTGSWTLYGIDEKGEPVKRNRWTDTMKAERAQIDADRAYVTTTDEMVFDTGTIPPRTVSGKEGRFLNADGTLGDHFMESMGQIHRGQKISDNVWTYVIAAGPQELAFLGLANAVDGQHVVVKVVTRERNVETHRITRVTTVHRKDPSGGEEWSQFVSLKGVHRRAQ